MPKAWVVTVRRWVGLGGSRNERRILRRTEIVGIHGRRDASLLKCNFYESAPSTKKPPVLTGGSSFQRDAGQRPALPHQAATVLATSWYSSIWSKFM